jgi:hypothetical protein
MTPPINQLHYIHEIIEYECENANIDYQHVSQVLIGNRCYHVLISLEIAKICISKLVYFQAYVQALISACEKREYYEICSNLLVIEKIIEKRLGIYI